LTAFVIAGHRLIPDVDGAGSLIDTAAPWLVLIVPVLGIGALAARSRVAGAALIVPLLVWLLVFGSAWWPRGGGATQLRVANQNVDAGNPQPAATVRTVENTGADLIGLEEVTPSSAPAIASTLDSRYPYHAEESTVQLWSRYRISDSTGVDLGLSWTRALRADVATPYGAVTVYVVHLASARAGQTATRDSTMTALVDRVRADPSRRIVVIGDLNTASSDRVFSPLTNLLRDSQSSAGSGPGFTWPSAFPLTRPDHILFRGLVATESSVVKTSGTDHRAIIAGLRF
jgi:vancomycin resistance protein VanJ